MSRRSLAAVLTLLVLGLSVGADDKPKEKAGDGQLPKELVPSTCTLHQEEIPLSKALKELARQTGNEVVDRRKTKDDPRLNLDLKKATFWQALDGIAREADARVSLYERDRRIALVDGPYLALPACYSGLFQITVKRIDVTRMLEPEAHYCVMHLEVAWEPRFQPFLLETAPTSLTIKDDKGNTLELGEMEGRGQAMVGRRNAIELEVRIPAPKRSAAQLAVFKGELAATGPTKMLTFTFPKLAKIERKNDVRKETVDDVTVHLRKFLLEGTPDDPLWTAEVLLEYPLGGPSFESFQSWLVNNEAHLEKGPEGNKEKMGNSGYETDDTTENKAILRYHFASESDKPLGKPEDWSFVYRTPGKIVEIPVTFEFKDLPLP